MDSKKNVVDIRNAFLSHASMRDKLLKKASALSRKESGLLEELRRSCLHDIRCLHFLGERPVRFCFMCGTREVAVKGVFTIVKGTPIRYVHEGQLTDPGYTVGPAVVQKMYSSLLARFRPRAQKQRDGCRS